MREGIIVVQVGQCGNQVGAEFFDSIFSNCSSDRIDSSFFREVSGGDGYLARSVAIDTEPKVINKTYQRVRKRRSGWQYDSKKFAYAQSGAANNWAFGYYSQSGVLWKDIQSLLRREVELCDRFSGFLFIQSVAGGTGSGVGAHLTEALREEYEDCNIMNTLVWPYDTGEVTVQSYNSLFSLSHIHQVTDAVWMFENSQVEGICRNVMNIKRPSVDDLNTVIARTMASVLLPSTRCDVEDYSDEKQVDRSRVEEVRRVLSPCGEVWDGMSDTLLHMCSHPGFKVLSSVYVPQMSEDAVSFSSDSWNALSKQVQRILVSTCSSEHDTRWYHSESSRSLPLTRSVSNLITFRGEELSGVDVSSLESVRSFPGWSLNPLGICSSKTRFLRHERSISLLMNSQRILRPIETMLQKAYPMYNSGAFVHQYERNGMSREQMKLDFLEVEQIVQNYSNL